MKVKGVTAAIPIIEGQAMASSPFNAGGAAIRGIRGEDLKRLPLITRNIKEGSIENWDKPDGEGVMIGRRLAQQLSLKLGDNLTLASPRGAVTAFGTTPRIKAYKILALFEVGMTEFDSAFVFLPFAEAQAYFNREGDATSIEVFTDNPDRVDRYRRDVSDAADRAIFTIDWRQRNASFFSALQVERNVMFMILTLIVLVAALNIVSGLIMLVKDKSHDIAILRTMGATRGTILRIFLITGASIGVVGTFAGFILGVVVCAYIQQIQRFVSWITGTQVWDPTVRFLTQIPAEMDMTETIAVLIMALTLSLLATLYPVGGPPDSIPSRPCAMSDQATEQEYPALWLHGVERRYKEGDGYLEILKGLEFPVWAGESVALIAPSGTGKSTLLHVAGLLEAPDGGEVYIGGKPTAKLDDAGRTRMRREELGFVYQAHHLLPEFTARENVMMPQMIRGLSRKDAAERADQLLGYLGLGERLTHSTF